MPEVQNTSYLSIGEVLGLLLEEFPDITISKIRFLESQGLIAPERTPSGYRKFYEPDVELLKVILREQRENYLPLRVIKDRIDSGAIDPSGEMTKPDDVANLHADLRVGNDVAANVVIDGGANVGTERRDFGSNHHDSDQEHEHDAEVPAATIAAHPASNRANASLAPDDAGLDTAVETAPDNVADSARADSARADSARADSARAANGRPDRRPTTTAATAISTTSPQLLPGVLLEAAELCAMTSITAVELQELRSYGIVTGRESGGTMLYGDDAVEIAKVAAEFLRAGIDARHLRGWRTAAEREASIFEQLITPKLRQRNPESRTEALNQLRALDAMGAKLRSALMRTALRHHFEG